MTDLDRVTLAGFTSIADLEQWAAEQNVLGEISIDLDIIDTDWLRYWVNGCTAGRYEAITTDHLRGLYHVITGLWL